MTKIPPLKVRDRRARDELAQHARSLAGKRVSVMAYPIFTALFDERIGHSVCDLLALSVGSAIGGTDRKRQCFVCCDPWAPDVAPVGAIFLEVVGEDEGLLSLICHRCWSGGADDGVLKALERDLGCKRETVRTIHDPVEAD
jgi:hypothetical protein